MRVPFFDLRVQDSDLRNELLIAFENVLTHGRLFLGPEVDEFETRVANYIGTKYAVGVDSGSSALYLALKVAGIKRGDEVITTPLTWIISSNAIRSCGAIPVFADVREDFNLDPSSIQSKITSKTKAIVPVHYAGHMCDMERICEIAKNNSLLVVEDAAQAFGASLNGRLAGNFSIAAGFSMNPMKSLGGYGEGGVVVTNDEKIYDRLKQYRHAGTTSDPKKLITNDCRVIALNHKMDTINAALLLVAMDYLDKRKQARESIAKRYNEELPRSVQHQKTTKGEVHGRYVYVVRTDYRDQLKLFLEANGVETKIMHEPLVCDARAYRKYRSDVPVARKVLDTSLVIPSHEKLTSEQVGYVITLFHEFESQSGYKSAMF